MRRYTRSVPQTIGDSILTPRQREVLTLVALGYSNQQVADELNVQLATVENHLHAIFGRLDVRTRTEAAVLAVTTGLIEIGPRTQGILHDKSEVPSVE